jgi:hypothetical protein
VGFERQEKREPFEASLEIRDKQGKQAPTFQMALLAIQVILQIIEAEFLAMAMS